MEKTQQTNNNQHARNRLSYLDWIIYFALAIVCFFSMQQGDILHTGGSSFSLLSGHILDFYEYNAHYLGGSAYMLTSYILFAIWNIPIYLLGIVRVPTQKVPKGVLMWYKALPTLCFFLSAYLIFRICRDRFGSNKQDAELVSFSFLAMPIAFFSQFCFGQYDSFTVLFMLLGLWFYYGNTSRDRVLFALFFGIAITFKYHAFLFLVPLLLLKEKRLWSLIKLLITAAIPAVIINIPYIHSASFHSGVGDFNALDYVFSASLEWLFGEIYLVPVMWVGVCVYAYMTCIEENTGEKNRELLKWSMFICSVVSVIAFGIMMWHPQWLMIMTPFMALALFASNRKDIVCFVDIALAVVYFDFVVSTWPDYLDQTLFALGVFGDQLDFTRSLEVRQLYIFNNINVLFTGFCCLLLASAWLKYPKAKPKSDLTDKAEVNWIRSRFYIPMAVFLVPMFICFLSAKNGILQQPFVSLELSPDKSELYIEYETDKEYDSIRLPVWSEENGQDDLVWYEAKAVSEGKWGCTVNIDDHNSTGKYFVNVYGKEDGVETLLTGSTILVEN